MEKGEWPANRRYFMPGHVIQGDSHSNTPIPGTPATGSSTPVLGVDYSVPISSDHLVSSHVVCIVVSAVEIDSRLVYLLIVNFFQ